VEGAGQEDRSERPAGGHLQLEGFDTVDLRAAKFHSFKQYGKEGRTAHTAKTTDPHCTVAQPISATSEGAVMSEQENVQAVQKMYTAYARKDFAALLNGFSDDVEWQVAGPADVPLCGSRSRREGVGQFFKLLGEMLETQQFEPREFIAQADQVVVLGRERHRVKSTGRTFEGDWVQVFTFREGTVVRYREYWDTAAVVAAFLP
jgi:ketosteroid isomerase-like protein